MKKRLLVLFSMALLASTTAWAGDYTDKSVHDAGDIHTYKHPKQRSFTSPFDFGPVETREVVKREPAPAPIPQGKCNCFTFDGTKSFDPDKEQLTYSWNFGDGQTGDKAVMNHCYDKAGDYTVLLTVTDASGNICGDGVTSTKVTANFPPTVDAGADQKICLGESALFNASNSTVSGVGTYTWDFGDGHTGEGVSTSHAYEKAGSYKVRVTVNDGKNTECSIAHGGLNVWVADRTTVSVKGTEAACLGTTASFEADGTGGSLKYSWDFGDGHTWEGGSRASHKYEKAGAYTVTVTADNGQGSSCSTAISSTSVRISEPPVADAGENLACCVGKDVTFDGSKSTGSGLSYNWNFGDGETAEGARVTHAYQKTGNFRVVLTVKDNSGNACDTSADSFVANVNAKPEAVIEVR